MTASEPAKALKILVVDDNADAAESLGMLLELSGHEVRLAYSGPQALSSAREFAADVIFLDLGLPGMDGFEVARELRADISLHQPVLIALTGWGADEDRHRGQAAGFDHHLVKPVDMDKLLDLIAAIAQQ
jgi:CheY-like chemotaxis protein